MGDAAGGSGIADLHMHTRYSDGADSPRDVLRWASEIGLHVIAVTDHDTIDGALEAAELADRWSGAPDVIVGEEVTSRDGHILALFIASRVPPDMSVEETVAAIHEQGGLAIAAHPYWRDGATNRHGRAYGVGDRIADAGFDAVEVLNGGFTPSMITANRLATRAAAQLKSTQVGGSDAHVKHALGWAHTRFRGRSARDLHRSVINGETSAGRSRLGVTGLRQYAFWSLGRLRAQPVTG